MKKRKTKEKKPSKRKIRESLINFRVTDEERAKLESKAKSHARGNVSVWIRHAALAFNPPKAA